MKKLILTLTLIGLIMISCSDENEKIDITNQKISTVREESNEDTQRIMYNLLTGQERLELWIKTLDDMVLKHNLNNNQKNILVELKANLNAGVFDSTIVNNDAREIFNEVYSKDFIKRARLIFTDQYLYDNLFSLRVIESIEEDGGSNGPFDCGCRVTTIWNCGGPVTPWTCKSVSCTELAEGCGFLGNSTCNGKCV